eukprot:TRINITY_DN6442_c0_g1_i1.p3 TRINITY_DN6442_c0_g1~~TRINITY_DN6442_c0_g1_i1.p3  ORF type:complete len:114 (+),score=2.56 TRINITY_DN6442_c0_g1_i1:341-682(+)
MPEAKSMQCSQDKVQNYPLDEFFEGLFLVQRFPRRGRHFPFPKEELELMLKRISSKKNDYNNYCIILYFIVLFIAYLALTLKTCRQIQNQKYSQLLIVNNTFEQEFHFIIATL